MQPVVSKKNSKPVPLAQMCLCGSQRLWRLLGVHHARLASDDLQLATAQKFTDLIREDIIWCELCRLNLLHSFRRHVMDS
jgi:hypothetical protein